MLTRAIGGGYRHSMLHCSSTKIHIHDSQVLFFASEAAPSPLIFTEV